MWLDQSKLSKKASRLMLHIGIVGCSTEGPALRYRTIPLEGSEMLGRHDHPEVLLHSFSLAQYMNRIDVTDWAGVAELMLASSAPLIPLADR